MSYGLWVSTSLKSKPRCHRPVSIVLQGPNHLDTEVRVRVSIRIRVRVRVRIRVKVRIRVNVRITVVTVTVTVSCGLGRIQELFHNPLGASSRRMVPSIKMIISNQVAASAVKFRCRVRVKVRVSG